MKASAIKTNINTTDTVKFKIEGFGNITIQAFLKVLNYLTFPLLILIVWETSTRLELFPAAILPSIEAVIRAFWELLENGDLLRDLSISLNRVVQGYSLAVVIGITFGISMGISTFIYRFFTFVFDAVRQIPSLAWIPLIILWFGIGEASKVIIIFKSAFFPILLNTISGIQNTQKGYIEVARLYKISKFNMLSKVLIPSALPSIFVGLRLGLGLSWMAVVASELLAASSGIGYLINEGRELSYPDVVIVGMVVIGVIGIIMDLVLKIIGKRILRWQNNFTSN